MAINSPRADIFTLTDYQDQTFQLQSRQELSRTAGGQTLAKDLGSCLWLGSWTTWPIPNDDALAFEAALNSLDGAIQAFEAGDLRRLYPRLYPDGAGANDGALATVTSAKTMTLSGLAAGQVISAGDYLSFTYGTSRALHQAAESVAANGSGVTPAFEVRPYIRAGYALSAVVKLKLPRGLFTLMPNSVSSKLNGGLHSVVTFQAVQVI